jgi:hypothetical protein
MKCHFTLWVNDFSVTPLSVKVKFPMSGSKAHRNVEISGCVENAVLPIWISVLAGSKTSADCQLTWTVWHPQGISSDMNGWTFDGRDDHRDHCRSLSLNRDMIPWYYRSWGMGGGGTVHQPTAVAGSAGHTELNQVNCRPICVPLTSHMSSKIMRPDWNYLRTGAEENFGPKRREVTGDQRNFHNKRIHNLYSSPRIITMPNSRVWDGRHM